MRISRCYWAPVALACVFLVIVGGFVTATSVASAPLAVNAAAAQPEAPTATPAPRNAADLASDYSYHLYFPLIAAPFRLDAPYPHPGAAGLSPNTYLTWRVESTVVGPIRFDVYLEAGDTSPDVAIATNLSSPALDPPTLALNTTYYWQVVARDRNDLAFPGPVWSFATEPLTNPPDVDAMVYIPEGEFQMGCDLENPSEFCRNDSLHREEPLHAVYLDSYWIDKYEVTNLEYRKCVAARVCKPPYKIGSWTRDYYHGNPAFDYYPVIYVSWWDGQAFCAWQGGRLPTEAEWEKAARGTIDTRAWPWGTELPDCSRENTTLDFVESDMNVCVGDTSVVGSHPTGASPYGVMDMSGNVFEWVQDIYSLSYYASSPYRNPQGPSLPNPYEPGDLIFTIRGGSYRQHWYYTRVAHRHWGHHGDYVFFRNEQVGFRCVRPAQE